MSPLMRIIIGGLIGTFTRKGDQATPNHGGKWRTLPEILRENYGSKAHDKPTIGGEKPKIEYTGDFPSGFGHAHDNEV
ncbi:MAG: hypothetical protein HOP25_06245 [Methylotenera sp.]|nr:hypothetical protein [Methylotenera sp.]